MTPLRTLEWRGILRARTPIAHGGTVRGTVHMFRREDIFGENGRLLEGIPSISGGVIRYSLRTHGARIMQHYLVGDERLPFTAVHALHNGGAMRETRTAGEVITGERQALLRELLPLIAVFGGMGGGRPMSGRLDVDVAVPVAKETAYLSADYGQPAPENLPSIYRILTRQEYGRTSGTEGALHELVQPGTHAELPKGGGAMAWQQEVLPAGSLLWHSLVLNDATPVEASFFTELLHTWAKRARIGGQRRQGMGLVTPHAYPLAVTDLAGNPAELVPCNWRDELADRKPEAIEALKWL